MTRTEQVYCLALGREYRVTVTPIQSRGEYAVSVPSPLGVGTLITSLFTLAQDTITLTMKGA
jgi:hypothetical protein